VTSIEARTAQMSGGSPPSRKGRVVELGMPEQDLDDPDVGAVLQQVGGEAVAQLVRADPFGDVGGLGCLDDDAIELPRADRLHRVLSGETASRRGAPRPADVRPSTTHAEA